MRRETVFHTLIVATVLCLVCSLLVSGTAVGLRSRIDVNREQEKQKNILKAAGLWEDGADIEALFEPVERRIVDLETGEFSDAVDPDTYDQRKASRDPQLSDPIPAEDDIAVIKRKEKYSFVYLVRNSDGGIDQVVLPIRGYGLWSTLRGFLAIDAESLKESQAAATVRGLTFYEHKETPGLGGEVDNPRWKALWKGKHIFDDDWNVVIEVTKTPDPDSPYEVDALSGATVTSRGVTNMLRYWIGPNGFESFLKNFQTQLRDGEGTGGGDG